MKDNVRPASPPQGTERESDAAEDAKLEQLGYEPQLKRALGGLSSFAIQFSTICFSGAIFIALTVGFGQVGPLMLWTFAGATALQCVVAFCIAELTSAYPLAGGVYQVVTKQAGRFLGWQTGWMIQFAHISSLALGTIGLTPLIAAWFGFEDLSHWQLVGISGVLILVTSLVNLLSVRVVAMINNVGVAAELISAAVITVGCLVAYLFFGRQHQSLGFLVTDGGVSTGSIVLPLLYSTLLAAFIVSGFDVSGTAGEETHDASRQVPKQAVRANVAALVIGSVVILLLMLGVPSVSGVVESTSPVKYILSSVIGTPLGEALEVAAVLSLLVNGMILQLAGARVLWAQARDGAFAGSAWLRKLNREQIPVNGVIVSGVLAFAITLYSSLVTVLAAILAVTWALSYLVALVVGLRARLKHNLPERPYVLRNGNFWYAVAIVWSAVIIGTMVYQNPGQVGVGLLGFIVLGVLAYATIGRRRRAAVSTSDEIREPHVQA
ncbi:APC family permease [Lentzea sp. NPDC059081]|uniref:APC family permease n=1 Tax=Lentzea sp. NPDC059081 TaxID=3346719 RepID=UPI003695E518